MVGVKREASGSWLGSREKTQAPASAWTFHSVRERPGPWGMDRVRARARVRAMAMVRTKATARSRAREGQG